MSNGCSRQEVVDRQRPGRGALDAVMGHRPRSHWANSSGVTMRTEKRIDVWSSPQNSAHTPVFGNEPVRDPTSTENDVPWPREQVALEAEARDPERVDDVDRAQVEAHRRVRREHELRRPGIGADDRDPGLGVVELPLPLEADDLDDELDVVFVLVDGVHRHEGDGEQHGDDAAAARPCRRAPAGCARGPGAAAWCRRRRRRRKRTRTIVDQPDDERRRRRGRRG